MQHYNVNNTMISHAMQIKQDHKINASSSSRWLCHGMKGKGYKKRN